MPERGLKPHLKTLSYLFAKVLFTALFVPYFRVRVVGRANVPRKGGVLLAANHFSFVDPLILGCFMPRRPWFVMAEDQFVKPVVHGFSRLMDVVPVKAGAAFKLAPIRKCLSLLKHGKVVAIFPEGRRSKSGNLLPAMPGLGVLASRSGAPVLPVAIVGTREAYPPGRRLPRPGRVTLYVGQPLVPPREMPAEEIANSAMAAIAELLRSNGHADYLGADSQILVSEEDVREDEA